ncbi:MAG: crossover junction endodeoxyribonuclease RuvC [Hyphomicrobiales bacterium]|nr:crossover junction endodeoxyribonuclease RuvC [Hyphomicrobiales bacterium]
MTHTIRIIGIDPGLRRTGWGVVEITGTALSHCGCGAVTSNADAPLSERLRAIHEGIAKIIADFAPHEAVVEETFVNKDARATLKLGQARGVVMLAPAQAGLPVAEYAPNAVKKAIVGAGHADKAQIHHMVRILLPKARPGTTDAADALALAICHAHHRGAPAKRAVAG